MNNIELKKYYVASVSGGKDSLYMLRLILDNTEKYPLDAVVHYELEIDYPFIKNVIDYMEFECNKFNIPFYRIKPRKTFDELYNKYGYPSRKVRWCNSMYKLDCMKQFKEFKKQQGYEVINYIGFCADEVKRFKNDSNIYPLAEAGIYEYTILQWAKNVPIFNDYYKYNKRCGCMYCPMSSIQNLKYLYVYYKENFDKMFDMIEKTETKYNTTILQSNKKYNAQYYRDRIKYLVEKEGLMEYE